MNQKRIFTLQEARALLPWLREVSEEAECRAIQAQTSIKNRDEARAQVQKIIQHWAETVAKLGAEPKQAFLVDFDSGQDYFCWEYPEMDILYRHDYNLGYAGRYPIKE